MSKHLIFLNCSGVLENANPACHNYSKWNLYDCNLNQCSNCGHIYQPISSRLRGALETIYLSFLIALTDAIVEPIANSIWYFILDKWWATKAK